ncbi:ADL150Cp [Eremothecium gossypii ATCC 10895]|uniref:Topoisomerase I damage affected protein 11 n=1 Tax=Eremothecium gossypii (strain ATCC 10895 / CBS 109.51 / FGSC 9923 / NRRL Y-1056) TaxID=284811 RepID=TDA11_EREGS|nr:ADL150Cp [Eremothecium gossypii ATCC 10895]Q75AS0.2 RecName: Full=Topoisomerase I damage affected protein 11 [Eremothecium gossypii ATCC 10895]AAS51770.2 ADL150Cp [Eremothecium gossypii ATCC 10895]
MEHNASDAVGTRDAGWQTDMCHRTSGTAEQGGSKNKGRGGRREQSHIRAYSSASADGYRMHRNHTGGAESPGAEQGTPPRRNSVLKRRSLIQTIMSPEGGAASPERGRRSVSLYSPASAGSDEGDVGAMLQTLATRELALLEQRKTVEDLRRALRLEERVLVAQARELEELKQRVARALDAGSPRAVLEPGAELPGAPGARESVWAKSMSFLNEFDQILQEGLEKRLGFDELMPSPATDATTPEADDRRGIWGLVSEFKAGLLGLSDSTPPPDAPAAYLEKQRNRSVGPEPRRTNTGDAVAEHSRDARYARKRDLHEQAYSPADAAAENGVVTGGRLGATPHSSGSIRKRCPPLSTSVEMQNYV